MRLALAFVCMLLAGCELVGGIELRTIGDGTTATTAGSGGGAGGMGSGGADCPGDDPTSCPDDCVFPCRVGPDCPQAVQLVGGGQHTCLLLDDGAVWCWGDQDKGQLGQGLQALPSPPVRVCMPAAAAISAGAVHTCALDRDGDVWCWGGNRFAESGVYGDEYVLSPRLVPDLGKVEAIESHGIVNCARNDQGALWCWGIQLNGQGWSQQEQYAFYPTPQQMPLDGVGVFGVRGYSACAVVGPDLLCWGGGDGGQLGNDAFLDSADPVLAGWPTNGIVAKIEGGSDHICALSESSAVYCWGFNSDGQCGFPPGSGEICPSTGGPHCFNTPQLLPFDPPGAVVDLAGGWRHMCALTDGGAVHCWGSNTNHEAGPGGAVVAPHLVIEGASVIGVGRHHSCAVVDTGVSCWGGNRFGQIDPDSAAQDFAMPLPIEFPP